GRVALMDALAGLSGDWRAGPRVGAVLWRAGAAGMALLLAACAGLPDTRARSDLGAALGARSGAPVELPASGAASLDADLRQRLAEPLTPEAAVEIAWLQGPRARIALARLGLAAADLFQASRPGNPS